MRMFKIDFPLWERETKLSYISYMSESKTDVRFLYLYSSFMPYHSQVY